MHIPWEMSCKMVLTHRNLIEIDVYCIEIHVRHTHAKVSFGRRNEHFFYTVSNTHISMIQFYILRIHGKGFSTAWLWTLVMNYTNCNCKDTLYRYMRFNERLSNGILVPNWADITRAFIVPNLETPQCLAVHGCQLNLINYGSDLCNTDKFNPVALTHELSKIF